MYKRFIIKGLSFLVVSFLIGTGLDDFFDGIVLNDQNNKVFWLLSQEGIQADVAIIGPSSVYNGLKPGGMHNDCGISFVNIGFHGLSALEQVVLAETFLLNNTVKELLVYMHPPALHSEYCFNKPSNIYCFLPLIRENESIEELVLRDHGRTKLWVWKYLPLARYFEFNSQYNYSMDKTGSEYDKSHGYSSYGAPYDSLTMKNYYRLLEEKGQLVREGGKFVFSVDPLVIQRYEALFEFCSKHGIRMSVFEMPTNVNYYNYVDFTKNRKYIKSWAGSRGIKYWNFSDLSMLQGKSYYNDDIHLNTEGSEVFSKFLADTVCNGQWPYQ